MNPVESIVRRRELLENDALSKVLKRLLSGIEETNTLKARQLLISSKSDISKLDISQNGTKKKIKGRKKAGAL